MKTHKQLYEQLCSFDNLQNAYKKARKGKAKKEYVLKFEENLQGELELLQKELMSQSYKPQSLKKFIVRDPKTRTIHASAFRDRIVHHAVVNILEPIFEKVFISDSYASRRNKGTHPAVQRFIIFMRKVSRNGTTIKRKTYTKNSIEGYILKADIKHYFETVDHTTLLAILRRKIDDEQLLSLVKIILNNFDAPIKDKGMPLGNFTSQFFANVYLNELDYFVKHHLRARYYIRYVDDFVILHRSRRTLKQYHERIIRYLSCLQLQLHPDKSKITSLRNGVTFLGYRIFYHYKLLRKRNIRQFLREFHKRLDICKEGFVNPQWLLEYLQGWFGYAQWANTYNLRKKIMSNINRGGGERPKTLWLTVWSVCFIQRKNSLNTTEVAKMNIVRGKSHYVWELLRRNIDISPAFL